MSSTLVLLILHLCHTILLVGAENPFVGADAHIVPWHRLQPSHHRIPPQRYLSKTSSRLHSLFFIVFLFSLFLFPKLCDILEQPNQLYIAKESCPTGVVYPFYVHNGIDKNANSVSVGFMGIPFCRVGLATIGVCVFCAATSVAALFIFGRIFI